MNKVLQLQPFISRWAERGFDVLFVSALSPEQIQRFQELYGVEHMEVVVDPGRTMWNLYEVRAVPAGFIIDGDGAIRASTLGWGQDSLAELQVWVDQLAPGED